MRGEGGNITTQEVLTLYDSCKEEVLTLYDTTTKRSGLPKGGYRRSLLVGGGAIAKTDGGKDTMDNRPKHQYFRNTVFPLISKMCQIVRLQIHQDRRFGLYSVKCAQVLLQNQCLREEKMRQISLKKCVCRHNKTRKNLPAGPFFSFIIVHLKYELARLCFYNLYRNTERH